ncbi:hypothetical protein [Sediminibacter sp. Hel_I_10]|uniref:hypothetical protein n=1 Tax=Sediminibacter sp. Hel_I_10 TaxID=1392490 RepID=UPI0004795A87|nr:hypothetical protein [Sediminibacter sp. Hel_I_10]
MQRFLKRIGVIFIGIFIIANLLSYLSLWALRQGSFYKPSYLINEIKTQNFDYIVLGASTGLTTLNTKVIDSVSGKIGINLSMDDTTLSSHYLMLEHFLAQGKSTSVCIIAPSVNTYASNYNSLSDNDYRFLPYVSESYVSRYFGEYSENEARLLYLSQWQPMLGVSYFNAELFYPAMASFIQPNKHNRFDQYGNYTYPARHLIDAQIDNREIINLEFKNLYLEKMKQLCDANDITLICYLSPLKYQSVEGLNTSYHVINHTSILNNEMYFYDTIHVNHLGRQVVSEQIAIDLEDYFKTQH